ncbi:CPBP family intramembrane glutamic endopeptidase [Thiomicrorhabdus sediminis]|uniref:CPBP family intramembrane metalloprotease n=1 Tax=Thiomicrorhabdus sediminis TaxID=2580412 RepID=A0A4V1HHW2_9GAMM|nr:CPBP family intramembrane glutamic endopeptidase [Thiomicrorhabdus sediminis]QCU90413.1 CPBP family intramembrane metalloprotease [Thiomicrorhabdus sediminis]
MNRYRYPIVFASIVFLIAAKVLPLWHINQPALYWDMDRIIALACLLIVAHIYIEKLQIRSFVWLLIIFVGSLLLNHLWLDLDIQRVLQLLLLTALVEEVLLRGVLFELLLKKWSAPTVLIATSVLFIMVHPPVYEHYQYGMLVFLSGLLLGSIYLHFRQYNLQTALVVVTAIHMLIILIGLNFNLIPVR